MLGFMPENLAECCAHTPIHVSDIIASSLPIFWKPRASRRRNASDDVPQDPSQVKDKPSKVKVEVKSKKSCVYAMCSLGDCNSAKIAITNSLMHFSQHQIKGDADTCICAYCGASDGHMPQLNKTGKKYVFEDPCCFSGNSLNVRKTKTIECSFPLKNYPVTCPSCNEKFWRFDLPNHFEISHTE